MRTGPRTARTVLRCPPNACPTAAPKRRGSPGRCPGNRTWSGSSTVRRARMGPDIAGSTWQPHRDRTCWPPPRELSSSQVAWPGAVSSRSVTTMAYGRRTNPCGGRCRPDSEFAVARSSARSHPGTTAARSRRACTGVYDATAPRTPTTSTHCDSSCLPPRYGSSRGREWSRIRDAVTYSLDLPRAFRNWRSRRAWPEVATQRACEAG